MIHRIATAGMICVFLMAAAPALAGPASQPAPTGAATGDAQAGELYKRISDDYLQGKWDDLEKELKTTPKELPALSAAQQADVKYVRAALEECRPAWWALVKAGKKVIIQPTVWGAAMTCTYDPAGKGSVQFQNTGKEQVLTVTWPFVDMDNPDPAEHGYSKGDLADLNVWNTLGTGQVWSSVPPQALGNDKDKTRVSRYVDFRGMVTGVYYGTPRARRWGLWLCLAYYMDKYAKVPTVESRKAIGAMFEAEVVANPAKYPSLKLPDSLPADGVESKLAEHFRGLIERRSWTIAEDKVLREAIKAFAAANDKTVLQAEKITLPNGLVHMIDTDADAPFRAKREAWLKAQYDKTR